VTYISVGRTVAYISVGRTMAYNARGPGVASHRGHHICLR
jgi:hypothetical protein